MGWEFPCVSTYGTDFPFDFGLAMTPEQAQEVPEVKSMIDDPPGWLADGGVQVGATLSDGLREGPGGIAFTRENGDAVYHTYTVMAPDRFVAPYYTFLLDRTPKPQPEEPRSWRKDEYPDSGGHDEPRRGEHHGVIAHSARALPAPRRRHPRCRFPRLVLPAPHELGVPPVRRSTSSDSYEFLSPESPATSSASVIQRHYNGLTLAPVR